MPSPARVLILGAAGRDLAVGYGAQQMAGPTLALRHPVVRVRHEVEEIGRPTFDEILGDL